MHRSFSLLLLGAVAVSAAAQEGFGKLDPAPPSGKSVDQIIQAMGQKESAFALARDNYVFKQSVRLQTINDDTNKPDGEYQQVTDIGFTKDGRRTQNVLFAPANTIERVILTQQDMDDIEQRLPFVLTAKDLPEYDLTYVGRQRIDELDTYVFEVAPKTMEKNRRYYKGKIWLDQQDLQIVLVSGKSVPDDVRRGHENLSPPFTTYYEQVDGKYWFPTYTKAEGTLHFPPGEGYAELDIHVKSMVKYTDYRQYRSSARIIYNGQEIQKETTPEKSTPAQPGSAPPK